MLINATHKTPQIINPIKKKEKKEKKRKKKKKREEKPCELHTINKEIKK